jgi:hypothetical protein
MRLTLPTTKLGGIWTPQPPALPCPEELLTGDESLCPDV